MDFLAPGSDISLMHIIAALALIAALLLPGLRRPRRDFERRKKIGLQGEKKIANYLRRNDFAYLHDKILPVSLFHPRKTQIDLVLFLQTGIYVIEVKHYAGKIYRPFFFKRLPWLQWRKKGLRLFQSPVKQNDSSVQAVKRKAGHKAEVHNVVVFTASGEISSKPDNVFYWHEFKDLLDRNREKRALDEPTRKAFDKLSKA